MTKTVKIPADLKVSSWSRYESPWAGWTDGARRYHIWLNRDGTPKDDVSVTTEDGRMNWAAARFEGESTAVELARALG